MNQETALRKGYETTGHYDFSRTSEMEAKLAEIKGKGYKALIVFVPSSPLSRGYHGGGYSIVVERRYNLDNCAASMRQSISAHEAKVASVYAVHAAAAAREIAELETRKEANQKWMADNGYTA